MEKAFIESLVKHLSRFYISLDSLMNGQHDIISLQYSLIL
jgi:hypothetical protein